MANVIDVLDELQNRALKEQNLRNGLRTQRRKKNRLVHFAESVRSWDMKFMKWILFAQERNSMQL